MHFFKNLAVSLLMIFAFTFGSSTAIAKPAGEDVVTAAVENTIANIQKALGLMEQGGDIESVNKAIKDARNQQKEFRFEVTERQRQRSGQLLNKALNEIKEDNMQLAEQTLREALASYQEMKATYDKTH